MRRQRCGAAQKSTPSVASSFRTASSGSRHGTDSFDVVTARKDAEEREFRSDHLAFHRYVEGLMEDYGLTYS